MGRQEKRGHLSLLYQRALCSSMNVLFLSKRRVALAFIRVPLRSIPQGVIEGVWRTRHILVPKGATVVGSMWMPELASVNDY